MPEEIFVIIIVAIAAGTFSGVVSQVIGYLKSRQPQQSLSSSDASMTTSELEGMIQKWIREANRPIADRLDLIEQRLDIPEASLKSGKKSLLEDMDGYDPFEEEKSESKRGRVKN